MTLPPPIRVGLALVIGLAVAACTVGPDYKRPEVLAPAEWRSPSDGPGSLADRGWWQLFEDPTLQSLIRTAVEANPDVGVAVARVAEARAQLAVARAGQFPELEAKGATRTSASRRRASR